MVMTPEMLSMIQVVSVAGISGFFTYMGIAKKNEKEKAVREVKEEARFQRLETKLDTSGQLYRQETAGMVCEIKHDISRLEKKQEKYNNLQERVFRAEANIKSLERNNK